MSGYQDFMNKMQFGGKMPGDTNNCDNTTSAHSIRPTEPIKFNVNRFNITTLFFWSDLDQVVGSQMTVECLCVCVCVFLLNGMTVVFSSVNRIVCDKVLLIVIFHSFSLPLEVRAVVSLGEKPPKPGYVSPSLAVCAVCAFYSVFKWKLGQQYISYLSTMAIATVFCWQICDMRLQTRAYTLRIEQGSRYDVRLHTEI